MGNKNKIYLQITSGRGPAECCRAVALVLEKILKQTKALGLITEVLERGTDHAGSSEKLG